MSSIVRDEPMDGRCGQCCLFSTFSLENALLIHGNSGNPQKVLDDDQKRDLSQAMQEAENRFVGAMMRREVKTMEKKKKEIMGLPWYKSLWRK